MPAVRKLSKLFTALADENVRKASELAAEIARDEERIGHHAAAKMLRGSLHPNGRINGHSQESSPRTFAADQLLTHILEPQHQTKSLNDVCLRPSTRSELDSVILEWSRRADLDRAAIGRRSRLLFYGPPGCGKSLCGHALGVELGLPTYLVRFDGIIGAYLGQTAVNLRQLFRFAESTPCVMIFDEVDALAKKRGNPLDVGELDRIVIAFMQELEHIAPKGLIVATSNLPSDLDTALWRRFDLIVEFPAPNKTQLTAFARSVTERLKVPLNSSLRRQVSHARSYSEAERFIVDLARKRILAQPLHAKRAPKK